MECVAECIAMTKIVRHAPYFPVADAASIRPSESQGGTWDAFFWVDEVEPLFGDLRDRGAEAPTSRR